MTDAELARLKELAERAAPGPWHLLHDNPDSKNPDCKCAQVWSTPSDWAVAFCDTRFEGEGFTKDQQMLNAAFIASARAAVPALIAEAERLQREVRDLRYNIGMIEAAAKERSEAAEAEAVRAMNACTHAEAELKEAEAEVERLRAAPDEDARAEARRLFFSLKFRAFPVTELDAAEDIDVIAAALTAARSEK